MNPANRRKIALGILSLYILLGGLYAVIAPVFESSDELSHYPFVKYIADGRGLPVQRPGQATLWKQEGSQPPLYYAVAAALTAWIDTDDLATVRHINPHARLGVPLAQDNKNMIIHPLRSPWPWQGTVLAVHVIRFFSVLLGAVTVWCTYRIATRLFPRHPTWALGAMALNAFNPMFVFISAAVNNDNLVVALSALTLLLALDVLQRGTTLRRRLVLGGVIGLACLTKLSALALVPLVALVLALQRFLALESVGQLPWQANAGAPAAARRTLGRALWAWLLDCLTFGVPVVLIAGWWYVRNWQLYGDPTGLSAMLAIAGAREQPLSLAGLLGEFQGFRISFWGLFGAVNVLMQPTWIYYVLDALSLLAVAGLVLRAVRQRRTTNLRTWMAVGFVALWVLVFALSVIRWTLMTMASQGRLIFSAMPAICALFALGLAAWWPRRWQTPVLAGMAGLLLALAATAPFTAIRPAYASPAILTVADVPDDARPVNATFGESLRLLAYHIEPGEVQPGQELAVTLYWEALAPMAEDWSLYIHVFGLQGQKIGQRDSYPGGGSYPTTFFSPGEVIRDRYLVPIDPDAQGPVAAEVEVGVYRFANMSKLAATDGAGRALGRVLLGRCKVAVPTTASTPLQTFDANLANAVHLYGYDLPVEQIESGASVPLTLYWQVTGKLDQEYTVFVQLLDETGAIVGQGDGPPLNDAYPTTYWAPGDWLVDPHLLTIQETAQPGPHTLIIGLYQRESGQRLPLLDESGQPSGDVITLAQVELRPAD